MAKMNFDEELKNAFKTNAAPSENLLWEVKRKMKQTKQKSPTKVLLKVAIVAAISMFSLCVGVFAAVNSSLQAANAIYNIPVLGKIGQIMTVREYEKVNPDNENFSAHIKQPQVDLGGTDAEKEVNKLAEEYVNEIIGMYEADEAAAGGGGHYEMTTGYETLTDNEDYFSMKIWTVVAMGGSNSFEKYYTIDKKTDKLITLSDLFEEDFDYKTYIYDEILRQMKENIAKDEMYSYFIPDDTDVYDGNFTQITGDEDFYINDAGNIVICFDKYEVAPGYMGLVSFEIKN